MPMTSRKHRQPCHTGPPPDPARDDPPSPASQDPDASPQPAPSDPMDTERAAEEVAERDHPLH
jgi:hypothetical protein